MGNSHDLQPHANVMCDTGVGRVWRMGLLLLLLPIDMCHLLGPLEGPTKFKIGLVRPRWSTCIRDMWHGGVQFDEWVPSCCCSHWHVSLFTSPCALHSAFNGSDDSGLIAFDALQIHQVTSWRQTWCLTSRCNFDNTASPHTSCTRCWR